MITKFLGSVLLSMAVKSRNSVSQKEPWQFTNNLLKSFMYTVFTTGKHQLSVQCQWIYQFSRGKKKLHTTFFSLLDRRKSNFRLFSKCVCFISSTSTQPSPKWQNGDIPFGLRLQAQDTLAPLTMKNFPRNVFHSANKHNFISLYVPCCIKIYHIWTLHCVYKCLCNNVNTVLSSVSDFPYKYKCSSLKIP